MTNRSERGFTLLEFALWTGLAASSALVLGQIADSFIQDVRDQATATQLLAVHRAASEYIQQNYGQIVTTTAGGPTVITVATLQAAHQLPPTFATTNSYGQAANVIVEQPQPGVLRAFAATKGGRPIPAYRGPKIANIIGADGGYVVPGAPGVAQGNYGAVSLAGLAATGAVPDEGDLAAQIYFSPQTICSDFLNRFAIAGVPECNTMHADLDMGGNNIDNARDITATTVGTTGTISATGAISGRNITAGQDITAQQSIQAGQNISAGGTVNAVLDLIAGRDINAARNVDAQFATIGQTVSAQTINAQSNIAADTITATSLSASTLASGTLATSTLTADTASANSLSATSLTAGNMQASGNMTVGGTLQISQGLIVNDTLSAPSAAIDTAAVRVLITQSCTGC